MVDGRRLDHVYGAVVRALGKSEFARRRGLHVMPSRVKRLELEKIVAAAPSGGRVLDIGTGLGVVPETLLRLGYQVVCVDVAMSESGKEPLQRLVDLGAEGHFAMVGEQPIPISDSSIDIVFAGDVIEHLPKTPKWFLQELSRVVKSGGWVILTTPNAVRLPVRIKVPLGFSNWPPVSDYINNPAGQTHHLGHHHEYTRDELYQILTAVGLTDVTVELVEDTLRRPNVVRSFTDIRTQDRFFSDYWRNRGRQWFNPFEIVRLCLLGFVSLIPSMRSTLIAVAKLSRDKA